MENQSEMSTRLVLIQQLIFVCDVTSHHENQLTTLFHPKSITANEVSEKLRVAATHVTRRLRAFALKCNHVTL